MSIRKIAEMTGLSIATVSNVINGTRPTSEESKRRVMAAAAQIGYRPNLAARMLRTQRSNTIAFIIPTDEANRNANFFYMDVLLGIHQKLWETGFNVIVANYGSTATGERSLSAVEVCRKQWVDGVIFVPSSRSAAQLDVLQEMAVPFVLVDRRVDSKSSYSFVGSDHEQGAYDAVQLLVRNGYRKIGFIGGALKVASGYERCRGYLRAIRDCGFGYEEEYVHLTRYFSQEEGRKAVRHLINKGVDGLLIADNALSMGAVQELQKLGVHVPEEIGVVGYDGFDWMEFTQPALTAVKQQAHKMGYLAAELIMKRISGDEKNEQIRLKTSLALRQSHGTQR